MSDFELPASLRMGYTVGILSQLFQTRVQRVLSSTDLTYSQLTVLSHLSRNGQQTVSEIADAVEINQPGATKIIQRLGDRGLVSTEPDDNDARRRLTSVTPDGFVVLGEAFEALGHDFGAWTEDWSDSEVASFTELAERLAGWLDTNRH